MRAHLLSVFWFLFQQVAFNIDMFVPHLRRFESHSAVSAQEGLRSAMEMTPMTDGLSQMLSDMIGPDVPPMVQHFMQSGRSAEVYSMIRNITIHSGRLSMEHLIALETEASTRMTMSASPAAFQTPTRQMYFLA